MNKAAIIGLGTLGIGYGLNFFWKPEDRVKFWLISVGLSYILSSLVDGVDDRVTCPVCPVAPPCPVLSCPAPTPCVAPSCPTAKPCPKPSGFSCPTPSPCPSPPPCPITPSIPCQPCPAVEAKMGRINSLAQFGSMGARVLDF